MSISRAHRARLIQGRRGRVLWPMPIRYLLVRAQRFGIFDNMYSRMSAPVGSSDGGGVDTVTMPVTAAVGTVPAAVEPERHQSVPEYVSESEFEIDDEPEHEAEAGIHRESRKRCKRRCRKLPGRNGKRRKAHRSPFYLLQGQNGFSESAPVKAKKSRRWWMKSDDDTTNFSYHPWDFHASRCMR